MIQLLPEKLSEPSGSLTTLVHARRMIKLEIGRCDDRQGWWIESQLRSEIRLSSRTSSRYAQSDQRSADSRLIGFSICRLLRAGRAVESDALEHERWPNKRKARPNGRAFFRSYNDPGLGSRSADVLGHVRVSFPTGAEVGPASLVYAVAVLRRVARAAVRRTADGVGVGGDDRVRRTIVIDAVAVLRDVADAVLRTAERRALGVGRARSAAARTVFGRVAGAQRRTANVRRMQEGIGRAIVADAVAGLWRVADARRGTTNRCGLHVGWAVVARPVAAFCHVTGAGRSAADRSAFGVGWARSAGPGTGFRRVAGAGRSATNVG